MTTHPVPLWLTRRLEILRAIQDAVPPEVRVNAHGMTDSGVQIKEALAPIIRRLP